MHILLALLFLFVFEKSFINYQKVTLKVNTFLLCKEGIGISPLSN